MFAHVIAASLALLDGATAQGDMPWLKPGTRDVIDVFSKGLGAVGIAVGALGVVLGARTRSQDLRWRKATAAHDTLVEIHAHQDAVRAIDAMDAMLVDQALGKPLASGPFAEACDLLKGNCTDKEEFWRVRRGFDWLLYYVDRAGCMVERRFVQFEEVAEPLAPYARLLCDHWQCFDGLVKAQNYKYAESFLRRVVSKLG